VVVAAAVVAGSAAPAVGAAPSTQRVSVSSASAEANGASGLGGVAISANGRYIAFISDASNLVPGDGNGVADVFVRDMRLHTTERVSVSSAGVEGNGATIPQGLAISPDGRFVTFTTFATNLAPGCPARCRFVYIRDRTAGTTRQIRNFRIGGRVPVHMVVSLGARFFAFDTVDSGRVKRCRLAAPGGCVTVSVLPPSVKLNVRDRPDVSLGGMSAGGRFVLFRKAGVSAPPTPPRRLGGVFVRDVAAGTTRTVSSHVGDIANAISPQGRFVLVTSRSSEGLNNDTNRSRDVFVVDGATGVIHRISLSSSEHQANGSSLGIAISDHGRYCLFSSTATNLAPGDTNGERDLFLRDRTLGTTVRVDVSTSGAQANGPIRVAALSADGLRAAWSSPATNLVPGDTNAVRDIFARAPLH
jgi:hypothetical protein